MFVRVRRTLSLAFLTSVSLVYAWTLAPRVSVAQDAAASPYQISYVLAAREPKSHLFEVTISVRVPVGTEHVDFQMPRWSPGRYAVFDFAKNVQQVSVRRPCLQSVCSDSETPAVRLDTQTWRAPTNGHDNFSLSYRVFADDLSGTFSQLDHRHANFNGASVLMYVVGHKQDAVSLRIDPNQTPAGWKVINGYTTRPDQREFAFPDYDTMIDTPTEIAPDWTLDEFKVKGKTYRVVIHSFENAGASRADFVRDIEKIVRAHTAMMPEPDYDTYTFIFHFDPTSTRGDGMEHLNSTQIIAPAPFNRESYMDALETASHEFFHVWNVKRLRPVGLGPWDFTRPVVTRGLWIAEGFTNYYGKLMMRRAGIWKDENLLGALSGAIATIEGAPGSRLMSAEEASLSAPFLDRSTHDQRTNLPNTSVSYYPKGETLALVLDLLIRAKTRGRASLDDVMRRAYEEFYLRAPKDSYYLRGRAFTPEDFERVVGEVTGADMSWFFERHVRSAEPPPYEEALAGVGLRLTRSPAERPHSAGITLDQRDPQSARVASIRTGSEAEAAGLKQGDVIVKIGEAHVTTASWSAALNIFKRGDRVPITYRRVRQTFTTTLTLGEPDVYLYRIDKLDGATPEARKLREAWMNGK